MSKSVEKELKKETIQCEMIGCKTRILAEDASVVISDGPDDVGKPLLMCQRHGSMCQDTEECEECGEEFHPSELHVIPDHSNPPKNFLLCGSCVPLYV